MPAFTCREIEPVEATRVGTFGVLAPNFAPVRVTRFWASVGVYEGAFGVAEAYPEPLMTSGERCKLFSALAVVGFSLRNKGHAMPETARTPAAAASTTRARLGVRQKVATLDSAV
jgi:hypothetical protein